MHNPCEFELQFMKKIHFIVEHGLIIVFHGVPPEFVFCVDVVAGVELDWVADVWGVLVCIDWHLAVAMVS